MGRRTQIAKEVVIASGESISGDVVVDGYQIEAVHFPPAWTAADLTFDAQAEKGSDFASLHNESGELVVPGAASRHVILDTKIGGRAVRVRSGTAAAPVNQGADRRLLVMLVAE